MLNTKVLDKVQQVNKKILIVTKYWDTEKTTAMLQEATTRYPNIFFGLGENRIETIRNKNIDRNKVHFIGNIQSQKIGEIVKNCGTIHSLCNLKHATKIENQGLKISAFIQINLDANKDTGISGENLSYFLKACENFKNLKIIGISGMGSADLHEQQKRQEFQTLVSLRDTHIPNGLISAGTSRDYELALEEGIDIVRVGSACLT